MEPNIRAFLIRVANSLGMVLVWMLVNMVAGIRYNLAFFEGRPSWANWLYYLWLLASFALLIRYLHKKWKNNNPEDLAG
jgi:hypothetical protein